jgi:peptidoglycan/LPS O-acetylase OafA/YrhL
MAGAEIFKRVDFNKLPKLLPSLIGLSGIGCLIWVTGTENIVRPHIHNGLLAPLMIILLVAFSLDKTILAKLMSAKPLVYLGNLTYGIYILQHPVYLWTEKVLGTTSFDWLDFAIYMAVLLGVSVLGYQLFEEPCRKWVIKKALSRVKTS